MLVQESLDERPRFGGIELLAAEQPEKVKELQARWDEWNQTNVKPLWGSGGQDNDGPEPGVSKKGKKKAGK